MHPIETYYTRLNQSSVPADQDNSSRSRHWFTPVGTWIRSIANQLKQVRLLGPAYEPRVRRKVNQCGTPTYQIYDPVTHCHHTFSSEEALRVWLDKRYYL